jgi:hypothetical protein
MIDIWAMKEKYSSLEQVSGAGFSSTCTKIRKCVRRVDLFWRAKGDFL